MQKKNVIHTQLNYLKIYFVFNLLLLFIIPNSSDSISGSIEVNIFIKMLLNIDAINYTTIIEFLIFYSFIFLK